MAAANSNVSLVGLDFNTIKNNLKDFLRSQSTFKDYDFEGSGLSVLLDVMAYNTQYNAFYLNMVANEMFMDTALQRQSVVSHAKLMNYTPRSSICPRSYVNIVVGGVTNGFLTLPAYTNFLSESVNGINYNFVNENPSTVQVFNKTAIFNNIELKQGIAVSYRFIVDSTSNPNYTFELPDANIDTNTIKVLVQQSSTNTSSQVYNLGTEYSFIESDSLVYFLQESFTGNYEIYFGDGVLGNKLADGNIVVVSYITTQDVASEGANNFVITDSVYGFTANTVINPLASSAYGQPRETIDSIKFHAPKYFSAQNRAVTNEDYVAIIQQNNLGISFDAINVWGGETNDPPVYGQVFICLKPKGALTISNTQKKQLVENVIKPVSVVTVEPTIIDPDYTYITIHAQVKYNPKLTNYTPDQLKSVIKSAIRNYSTTLVNTFESTFASTDVGMTIKNADPSIITSDVNIRLQKKFYPNLTNSGSYVLRYNATLEKGVLQSGITSSPPLQFIDPNTLNILSPVYIEEVPSSKSGIQSISIINPGYSYQTAPTIKISGDGNGATAQAILTSANGYIQQILVTNSGNNYSYATVTITPAPYDNTGTGGAAAATLSGGNGTLRTFYYDTNNNKTIINPNIGTIDYTKGILNLANFDPIGIDEPFGKLSITATPLTQLVSSSRSSLITIDPYDDNAIVVDVVSQ